MPEPLSRPRVISAETYRAAAEERVSDARALLENEAYVAAHYMAGLAVECIRRAYWMRSHPGRFDPHHNLMAYCLEGGFFDYISQRHDVQNEVRAALSEVRTRWLNKQRFWDEGELQRYLRVEARLDPEVGRAKKVRVSAERIVDAAIRVVSVGRNSWDRPRRGL